MTRVFIADDHPIFRAGLRKMLDDTGTLTVVGEASDGRQVLQAPHKDRWDLLVLDISLPRVNGIEVLRRVRVEHPSLRVLILSMFPEEQYAALLRAEGAKGYCAKDAPPEELLEAIRRVMAGGTWPSTDGVPTTSTAPVPPHATLTAREYQVFTLVFQGTTVTEIAAELNLGVSTVSNHLSKVKEKLGARTVADVVAYAHRAGLVG